MTAERKPKLTSLEEWADTKFAGRRRPSPRTLRRWVKEFRISPRPKKLGLRLWVYENAELIDPPVVHPRRDVKTFEAQHWFILKKLKRIPPWADRVHIRGMYESAVRVSRCLGIAHHVDHVFPLRGRLVSGLHVPGNLRVIPGVFNMQKSNRWQAT